MFIKPASGLKVRDPVKKDLLPETGRQVKDGDLYWVRRLADGDVVEATPPSANGVRTKPAITGGTPTGDQPAGGTNS